MVKISKKAIGLLGGSFDPAHKGHLKISKIAIKKLKLNAVLWLVTKKNPFKEKPLYSIGQRLAQAKRITKNMRNIKVIYLDKTVKSTRSIDIINYLILKKKLKVIYFIIGSDNLITFHKWKSWKKIVKLTKLIVFSRKGYDRKGYNSIVAKYLKNKIIFIKNKPILISSSKLRKHLRVNN
tara:strand:+ start:989 stop:1528 length:540 start_codon:yes stop_codon:yes gene_type:complete